MSEFSSHTITTGLSLNIFFFPEDFIRDFMKCHKGKWEGLSQAQAEMGSQGLRFYFERNSLDGRCVIPR